MPSEVKLTGFRLPAYRVELDVLLFLARSLREALSAPKSIETFERSKNGSWLGILRIFGALLVNVQFAVYETAKIGNLWNTFLNLNSIKTLERELREILESARDDCVKTVQSGQDSLSELHWANEQGHAIVKRILAGQKLEGLLPANPLPVEAFYDAAGEKYCAGAHPWTDSIRWAYQHVAHALEGAIIADSLFAHEYLSHLVPRNHSLDQTIQEQWLVAALLGAMRDDQSRPYWKHKLWTPYRSALLSHVTEFAQKSVPDASPTSFAGCEGAEEVLSILYLTRKECFWRLTSEILNQETNTAEALKASKIACALASRGHSVLPDTKLFTLSDLYSIVLNE